MKPSIGEVTEAIAVMQELFNLMSALSVKMIKVDGKAYCRRNALGTLLDVASAYVSGEIDEVAPLLQLKDGVISRVARPVEKGEK